MIDQFPPGRSPPAGSWLYLLQDKLFPSAIPHTAAWIPTLSSEVEAPDGGLFGILADPNARRDQIGPAGSRPAGGVLDLPAPNDRLSAGAPHWLQTANPFGAGFGAPQPQSNPRPQGVPALSWAPAGQLDEPKSENWDPTNPYWLQSALIPRSDSNSPGLPTLPDGLPLPSSPAATWAPSVPTTSTVPPSAFATASSNGSWNEDHPSFRPVPPDLNVELSAIRGAPSLNPTALYDILTPQPNRAKPDDAREPHDAITAALPPARGATAIPMAPFGLSPIWPSVPSLYPADERRTNERSAAQSDARIVSDVTPSNEWQPGAQYANGNRPPSGPGLTPIRINGRWFQMEGGQAVLLTEAQTRAENAIARVREREPKWHPTPSFAENVEGQIRAYEAEAKEAQARLRELTRLEFSPIIPIERPPTASERNSVARDLARWFVNNHRHVIEGTAWLAELEPSIDAYRDPPKTLEDLWRAVSHPKPGYDIHHIVESGAAAQDGFPRSMINSRENLVRIPRFKHWEITAWYMTKNRAFGELPPREYLRGKDWNERGRIGLDALIQHGVLAP
jgi:hypothetical protein